MIPPAWTPTIFSRDGLCQSLTNVHPSALVDDLRALLNSNEGDILIRFSDGATTLAHSAILGARSAVMRAMFNAPMQEAETKSMPMQCCKSTGMALLHFLYTGQIDNVWPSSVLEASEMGALVDFFGVKGLDEAFGQQQCEALISKVNAEVPPESDLFWVNIIGVLVQPGLPVIMRRSLVNSVVKRNLTWGRGVFLAFCVADSCSAEDVQQACLDTVRSSFSTQAMLAHSPFPPTNMFGIEGQGGGIVPGTFSTPIQREGIFGGAAQSQGGGMFGTATNHGGGRGNLFGAAPQSQGGSLFGAAAQSQVGTTVIQPSVFAQSTPCSPVSAMENKREATGFETEFAEARLAECIVQSSPVTVLRSFIKFQAEVNRVMKYRTGAVVEKSAREDLKFNKFQSDVHARLAEVSITILEVCSPKKQQCAQDKSA